MFDFEGISEQKRWLRSAGLHQAATLVSLDYVYNEFWEAFDIEFKTADGVAFKERTFGPNIDKVYPKAIYANNVAVGMETPQQAVDRVSKEIATKLYHLACCFVTPETVKDSVKSKDLKGFVGGVKKLIEENKKEEDKINFLTIWKNSDTKKKSNLIIAPGIKWCEATVTNADGTIKPATIQLTKTQQNNGMVEKYPYQSTEQSDAPVLQPVADDLPF